MRDSTKSRFFIFFRPGRFFLVALGVFLLGPVLCAAKKEKAPIIGNPLKVLKPLVWDLELASFWLAELAHRREPFGEFTRPPDIADRRSLAGKARLFEKEIERYFLRDSGRLFWSQIPNDLGDMAIWQGYYTAYRAFEYAVTKSTRTLGFLKKALQGHVLLQAGYGEAYLVRGVDPAAGDALRHPFYHEGHPYSWVDDASGSSLSGIVFGLNAAYQFGDAEARGEAKRLIVELAGNFIKHNYRLLNTDARPSRWGDHRPSGWALTPPRLLTAIALLNLARAAGGDEVFSVEKNNFFSNAIVRKIAASGEVHFLWYAKEFNQHLAFMNYYVL
ncbi:MAG: hypothetical protein AAB091_02115 [Elusimicrobiota bacterium]